MASIKCMIILIVMLGVVHETIGVLEDTDKNFLGLNYPYGGGMDNDLQLVRLLLLPQRLYHPKRNSELINSLLALPKNVNNVGK
ncbi:pigment-dispersing factor [Megalopta genalis]|uniref:pigment-dispersing factor n=1 Tax=Megalopta genalis TaxID=115081 RepID=UPI001442FF1D|nr:pigment-dispersing hormone peptides-like [Megalopta genalis]XP_033335155.1 pigment-dispersing hormone peptides-like [Megalopta genalis]